MPVMGGLECVSCLRSLGYRGRIVALTGHDDDASRAECKRVGFDDHLTKPFKQVELLAMVDKHKGRNSEYKYV